MVNTNTFFLIPYAVCTESFCFVIAEQYYSCTIESYLIKLRPYFD